MELFHITLKKTQAQKLEQKFVRLPNFRAELRLHFSSLEKPYYVRDH